VALVVLAAQEGRADPVVLAAVPEGYAKVMARADDKEHLGHRVGTAQAARKVGMVSWKSSDFDSLLRIARNVPGTTS